MGKKVLYIEDNEQNLYLVKFILNTYGYEVIPAGTGQYGISLAEKEVYDLVLLDIQLPVMDGYAVAHRLRTLKNYDKVPIVAVTSYAMPGDRDKAFDSGCTGYIEKPINPDIFIHQINEFLPGAVRQKEGDE